MSDLGPGVPIWVDVSSSDIEKTRSFYQDLFGWTAEVPEGGGGYTLFLVDGKMVAGGGPTQSPEQHPAWSTYIGTDDAKETARKAAEADAQVIMEPFDVMGQGQMAVLSDPTGAFFCLWQPQAHRGAQLVNKPGSFCWNELYTRDVPRAQEFYSTVFGWTIDEQQMDMGPYTVFKLGDHPVAGGMNMGFLPDSVPPHWLTYFAVDNTDATVSKARELGAQILAGPQPTPLGPMAVIQDPVGAAFAVIQLSENA